jgi:hypothetical protein
VNCKWNLFSAGGNFCVEQAQTFISASKLTPWLHGGRIKIPKDAQSSHNVQRLCTVGNLTAMATGQSQRFCSGVELFSWYGHYPSSTPRAHRMKFTDITLHLVFIIGQNACYTKGVGYFSELLTWPAAFGFFELRHRICAVTSDLYCVLGPPVPVPYVHVVISVT